MRRKYLFLLLIPLLIAFAGCGRKKHFAPPPASPSLVQITNSWLEFYPNTRWRIRGQLASDAKEPCLVELFGCLCDQETGERKLCNDDKFYLKEESGTTFTIWFEVGGRCFYEDLEKHPDGMCNYDYTVEITGVEIEY